MDRIWVVRWIVTCEMGRVGFELSIFRVLKHQIQLFKIHLWLCKHMNKFGAIVGRLNELNCFDEIVGLLGEKTLK